MTFWNENKLEKQENEFFEMKISSKNSRMDCLHTNKFEKQRNYFLNVQKVENQGNQFR